MIREPMQDDEPVMVAVCGPYAFGYLRAESGHHRLRVGEDTLVARVGVAPVGVAEAELQVSAQKALKQSGQYGGRVRSRIEISGGRFVVQNAATLAENRELAEFFAPSWLLASAASDRVVRRYDVEPFLVNDFLTATRSGRRDALHAGPFHKLLCRRIEAAI